MARNVPAGHLPAVFTRILTSAVLALVLWCPEPADALLGNVDGPFGLDANLRTVTGVTRNYDLPTFFGRDNDADGISVSLLRLQAEGRPTGWLRYEVHLVQSLAFGFASMPGMSPEPLARRYRVLDWSPGFTDDPDVTEALDLDRALVKISLPWADVTVGRQPVTFGKAYFWNPMDFAAPFGSTDFDRDFKPGVDGVRVDLPLGAFSGVNLLLAAGRPLEATTEGPRYTTSGAWGWSMDESAAVARVYTSLAQWDPELSWDLSAMVGKVYRADLVGAGLSGEVGGVEIRAEATYLFDCQQDPLPLVPLAPGLDGTDLRTDHLTGVLGLGYRFPSSLTLEGEYLYQGMASDHHDLGDLVRLQTRDLLQLTRHVAGVMASYELLPILTAQVAVLESLSDGSGLVQPSFTLSVSDESDFLAGAMVSWGDRPTISDPGTEFGTYPDLFYMEYKLFF